MNQRPEPAVPGKVFITGANGFIGRALAARLRELGAEVAGVDLVADPANGVVAGSTTDPGPWEAAMEGAEVVVHLAAAVSMVAPWDEAWRVNVLGTRRMLEASASAGARRFVHFSSVAAFGFDYPDGVDESYPTRVSGKSSYIDTKINSEAVALAAHAAGELEVVVIRPADVYGPGSVWITEPLAIINSGLMVLPDGGRGAFHAVYIDDLVDGCVLALCSPDAAGHIFTIGARQAASCREYFGALAALAGGRITYLPSPVAVPLCEVVGRFQRRLGRSSEISGAAAMFLNRPGGYSVGKARRVLGFEPRVGLDEGLEQSAIWARAEGLLAR